LKPNDEIDGGAEYF